MTCLDATGLFLQRNRNFLLISKKSMFWHPSTSICKFSKTPELLRECKFHKFCFHCVPARWTSFRNVIWTAFLSLKFVIKSKCQFDLFLKFLSNHLLGKNTVRQNTARKNRFSKVEYRHTVLHESTWFNNLQLWVKTIKIIYKYENNIICIFSFYRFSKESPELLLWLSKTFVLIRVQQLKKKTTFILRQQYSQCLEKNGSDSIAILCIHSINFCTVFALPTNFNI